MSPGPAHAAVERVGERTGERTLDRTGEQPAQPVSPGAPPNEPLIPPALVILARAERVIFIDAAIDTPPGEVRRRRLMPDRGALSTMAHFHDPRELLAWCEALYGRAPEAWLVSGGGAEWDYACYALSETAQQALEPMIAEVLALITAPEV